MSGSDLLRPDLAAVLADEGGQAFPAAHCGGRLQFCVLDVHCPLRKPLEQFLQSYAPFHSGERRTDAGMNTASESDVRRTLGGSFARRDIHHVLTIDIQYSKKIV